MFPSKSLNHFFDEWRAIIYIATAVGLFSTGVILPSLRIGRLEAQQLSDQKTLATTTEYMRVLATATCLDKQPRSDLMAILCDRVLHDPTILAPPK